MGEKEGKAEYVKLTKTRFDSCTKEVGLRTRRWLRGSI
jgi:hypothetical protein